MVNELPTIELKFNKRLYVLIGVAIVFMGIAYVLFQLFSLYGSDGELVYFSLAVAR